MSLNQGIDCKSFVKRETKAIVTVTMNHPNHTDQMLVAISGYNPFVVFSAEFV